MEPARYKELSLETVWVIDGESVSRVRNATRIAQ